MHIVTAKEMYEVDRFAMEEMGMDGKLLMENAGRAIAECVGALINKDQSILVLVGGGNNGGDGFVIARTLLKNGYEVTVLQIVADDKIIGNAAYHKQLLIKTGAVVYQLNTNNTIQVFLQGADVIVDAMLGIGVSGPLRAPFNNVVDAVNESTGCIISVDIPSGVPADEAVTVFEGVVADYTFIVEEPKVSLFLEHTAPYYGKWDVVDIGIPNRALQHLRFRQRWGEEEVRNTLPDRKQYSYKGKHGRGLIVGGASYMPGSVALSAKAALRAGAGLITVGTVPEAIPSIASHCSEAMYLPLSGRNGVVSGGIIPTSSYQAIAVGMGIGREDVTGEFVRRVVMDAQVPVIIDADGIFHIKRDLSILSEREHPTILTPHVGEMSLLTDKPVKEISVNPFAIAKEFACCYQIYLVLKGPYTIITDPQGKQTVSTTGNPGLAKGGSGDVLAGILLAMIMQEQPMMAALSNGCYLHGNAADRLVADHHSEHDLLASDIVNGLASAFRTFSE